MNNKIFKNILKILAGFGIVILVIIAVFFAMFSYNYHQYKTTWLGSNEEVKSKFMSRNKLTNESSLSELQRALSNEGFDRCTDISNDKIVDNKYMIEDGVEIEVPSKLSFCRKELPSTTLVVCNVTVRVYYSYTNDKVDGIVIPTDHWLTFP